VIVNALSTGYTRLARAMGATSLLLHAPSGVGVLLAREGKDRGAAEVLFFSLGHEAMPATYRQVAEPTLRELQAKLEAEDLASAREAAAGLDLDELVSETLGDRVRQPPRYVQGTFPHTRDLRLLLLELAVRDR
jgi:hypothetical protein